MTELENKHGRMLRNGPNWVVRLLSGLTVIAAVSLFLGFVPAWGCVVLLVLGGALVASVLHGLDT